MYFIIVQTCLRRAEFYQILSQCCGHSGHNCRIISNRIIHLFVLLEYFRQIFNTLRNLRQDWNFEHFEHLRVVLDSMLLSLVYHELMLQNRSHVMYLLITSPILNSCRVGTKKEFELIINNGNCKSQSNIRSVVSSCWSSTYNGVN